MKGEPYEAQATTRNVKHDAVENAVGGLVLGFIVGFALGAGVIVLFG